MSDDDLPPKHAPGEPPVPDPAEVERLLKLGVENPAMHGPMFRALMAARVWFFIPPHPEMVSHERDETDPLTWLSYKDDEGLFVPVFTSGRAAEQRADILPEPKPMMAEVPARVLFAHLNSVQSRVLVIASNGAEIVLEPGALDSLVKGQFTVSEPGTGERQAMTLLPLAADDVPSKLRQAIRVFCVQRQGAMAVYVFHPVDAATGTANERELRIVVRLRDNPGHFYNDFQLMVSRMTPAGFESLVGAAEPDDEKGMAFLARCTPLWPIV